MYIYSHAIQLYAYTLYIHINIINERTFEHFAVCLLAYKTYLFYLPINT